MERAALQLVGLQPPPDYINHFSTCKLGRFIELEEADESGTSGYAALFWIPAFATPIKSSLFFIAHSRPFRKAVAPCRNGSGLSSMLMLLMRAI